MTFKVNITGFLVCTLLASLATYVSAFIHIGAVSNAIILGFIIGNILKLPANTKKGIDFCATNILSVAIAFMGLKLNFLILQELGFKSIAFVVMALIITIITALVLGKIFKLNSSLALLLGIGNAVCGSSAIAATEKIIGAKEEDVGLSIAIVNFLGSIGIFLVPFLAVHLFKMNELHSGMLIGNTLQAVGQVVAAGFSISDSAGQVATIIKMARILMLLPLFFVLIPLYRNKQVMEISDVKKPGIPLFIIGFIFCSIIASSDILNQKMIIFGNQFSHILLMVAMAGIGLKIKIQSILQNGFNALLTASLIFIIQLLFSSLILYLLS